MTISHSQPIPLPDLRIVPTSAIQPHEDEDTQRAQPLAESISREGLLRNPIIVTPRDYGMGYLVLDGTNRYTAFRQLEIEHMLVQAVPYSSPSVELASWNHVIGNTTEQTLLEAINALCDDDDTQLVDRLSNDHDPLAVISLPTTERTLYLINPVYNLPQKMTFLRKLVNTYMQMGRLNRTTSSDSDELLTTYPDMTACIEFTPLHPEDIITLTHDGYKVPAGVTRHIIQGRVLRVNYPLSHLKANLPLKKKNEGLDQWVRKKFADRNVRLYTEATYQFEE